MNVRYRTLDGRLEEVYFKPPDFQLRDGSEACLNDYVSDRMDQVNIKYKWFRILK